MDVRIITPGIPDKPCVYYVTQSYYPELFARACAQYYEYTPAFARQNVCIRRQAGHCGSANTDYRSLYLHYENCCQFFGGHIVGDVKADFLRLPWPVP